MKKLYTIFLSIFLFANFVSASGYNVIFSAGLFQNPDGSDVSKSLSFAIIADVKKADFSDFYLTDGDAFAQNTYINSSNNYLTIATGNLEDRESTGNYIAYSNGEIGWTFDNETFGFTGGEQVAIVVWDGASSSSVSKNDVYCIFTPSMAGDELSGGDAWQIPASNSGKYQWYMFTESAEGSIDNAFGKLSNVVIPEPSSIAVVLGAIACGLAVWRRRS